MPEQPVPPLKREALDQIPTVPQNLVEYWSVLQQTSTTVLPKLEGFDPDRLPASQLAQWVEGNQVILQRLVNPLLKLHHRLWTLQEYAPAPELLDMLIEDLEDEAAPTD